MVEILTAKDKYMLYQIRKEMIAGELIFLGFLISYLGFVNKVVTLAEHFLWGAVIIVALALVVVSYKVGKWQDELVKEIEVGEESE